MGGIPRWLLRKTVRIAPYTGVWGTYGAPGPPVRCGYDERLITATQQAGVVRNAVFTVVAPLGTVCPEGSRVTLDDGRVGYAAAVARHDSGGLPRVPDHVEIAVALAGPSYGPPLGGEQVTILHRVATGGTDRYGNPTYTTTEVNVPGVAVRVVSSTETPGEGGSSLATVLEMVFPPGTTVGANDRVRARGLVYEVDGEPQVETDPMVGGDAGVKVIARRASG